MKAFIIGLIAILVVGGGGYLALQKDNKDSGNSSQPAASSGSPAPETESGSNNAKPAAATITYSDSGFGPSSVSVKSGDTVAIKNDSSGDLQFESNPHPAHTDNEELNVGAVGAGQTVTFKVTQKGTFDYHNHFNPGNTGSITVE